MTDIAIHDDDDDGYDEVRVGSHVGMNNTVNEVRVDGQDNLQLGPGDCGRVLQIEGDRALVDFRPGHDEIAWVDSYYLDVMPED